MLSKTFYSGVFCLLFLAAECAPVNLPRDEESILLVYHYKVPCVGENVQWCYRIKKNDSEPQFLHDRIEGFEYEWGYNYTISVETVNINNPQSDLSSFKYKLKK